MSLVTIIENVADPETWETMETDTVLATLYDRFDGRWPDDAELYAHDVAEPNKVTPQKDSLQEGLEFVDKLQDEGADFFVVVQPKGTLGLLFFITAAIGLKVAQFLLNRPEKPRKTRSASPNNELTNRQNRERPNERIPDIFGTVRSTPDLLSVPYSIYENNRQVEYSYLCIGRGKYEIPSDEVKDDKTRLTQLAGSSVEIYDPYTSPRTPATPAHTTVGTAITQPLMSAQRSSAVEGQQMRAPNAKSLKGKNIQYVWPDEIHLEGSVEADFQTYFEVDDDITITNSAPGGLSFNGTYKVLSVTDKLITIGDPVPVNANWGTPLQGLPGSQTAFHKPTIAAVSDKWIGPFDMQVKDMSRVYLNLVAPNGLWLFRAATEDDPEEQIKLDIDLDAEITELDEDGNPTATVITVPATMEGSATVRDEVAITIDAELTWTGSARVRLIRRTPRNLEFKGETTDRIEWRDMYAISDVPNNTTYGDVTTVYSRRQATGSALAVKAPKLNMIVKRLINDVATSRVDDILEHICLDTYIGRREAAELDKTQWTAQINEAAAYFGDPKAVEFNGTIDDDNLSFEEVAAAVANAAFCRVYRQGKTILLSFEKATEDSLGLFNGKNILPDSQTRTVRFGNYKDYDSVEFEYILPDDDDGDVVETFYVPEDRSGTNAKKVESFGIRSKLQAHFHAYREYNKLTHETNALEMETTHEANGLIIGDRIRVADRTRATTQDGEVVSVNGLELELDRDVDVSGAAHNIFLQLVDGSTQSLRVLKGSTDRHVVMQGTPRQPLVTQADNDDNYARTVWHIVRVDQEHHDAFLVSEKTAEGKLEYRLECVNYDARYYANDRDLITNKITAEGNAVT